MVHCLAPAEGLEKPQDFSVMDITGSLRLAFTLPFLIRALLSSCKPSRAEEGEGKGEEERKEA